MISEETSSGVAAEPGTLVPARDTVAAHHSLLTLFTLLWGGNFVLAEVALREMTPIAFSVARFVLGALALVALLGFQGYGQGRRQRCSLARRDWPRLLLVAVLGAALAPWLGIEGLHLTHAGRASLWLALGPVVSAGVGMWLGTERIGAKGRLGLLLAALGTVGLALDGLRADQGYWLGDALLLLAVALVALELHLIKPLALRYGATPVVTARTVLGGTLYLLAATPVLVQQPWLTLSGWTWVAIVVGGTIGVGMGQWVKVRALRRLGPTRVVLYGNLVPLAALLLAWLTLGTVPSLLELASGGTIILGALLLHVLDAAAHASPEAEPRALVLEEV